MRGVVIFLGLLLLLAGGALAAAQYLPLDLSPYLSSMPGAAEFVGSQNALYAGGGAAAAGLVLMIIGAATGGARKAPRQKASSAKRTAAAPAATPQRAEPAAPPQRPPAPQPVQQSVQQPKPAAPAPAQPAPQLAGVSRSAAAKPQASAHPPASAQGGAVAPAAASTWTQDPRLHNRKRVSDLVSINDALKAYHAKHGAYPKAEGLRGHAERGTAWIPGLSPDFIKALPRDPTQSGDPAAPQYLYVSNGTDYKLLAHGVALAGGTNVEVLGVKIDESRNPTAENASFGFWTPAFASV